MNEPENGFQAVQLNLEFDQDLKTHCFAHKGSKPNCTNHEAEETKIELTERNDQDPVCAICLDSLNSSIELLDVPPCGHRFHKKCLTK